jgi:two-component system response regulator DesR
MVVENNAAMRALIRSLVEPIGPVVHECDTGESAVEAYARLRPACVLMDIQMGAMDGIAATRAIRRSDPDARVIIITEHGEERYRRAAREAGASGFLLKENLLELPRLVEGLPE